MSTWKIESFGKISTITHAVMIEGLPGIGNVGKVATDFVIDQLNALKLYEITSPTFPNSVFVNENNLVELPKIELYHKKIGDKNLLFLAGEIVWYALRWPYLAAHWDEWPR